MPTLEELSVGDLRAHMEAIVNGTSNVHGERRDKLIAKALATVLEQLEGPVLTREDLIARCTACDSEGWIKTGPNSSSTCTCHGTKRRLTEAGWAVKEVADNTFYAGVPRDSSSG